MQIQERFRSADGAQQFIDAYNYSMSLWTVPYDVLEVETSYGTTHVKVTGQPYTPPLVLIHGGQISSPMWYANVESLSQHFRVYMPDVIDQMGMSVPTRKLKTGEDCAGWLVDVLDGLKLSQVHMGGHSHGGWQTLNMAIRHPERLKRIVLLSPASSFTRLSMHLMLHMLPVLVRPTRHMFYWSFQSLTMMPLDKDNPYPLVEQFMTGALTFKPEELSLGVVYKFKKDELRAVNIPTLLLISENETVYSRKPAKVIEIVRQLMPDLTAHLIPEGKHLFPISQAEQTNRHIIKFLLAQ